MPTNQQCAWCQQRPATHTRHEWTSEDAETRRPVEMPTCEECEAEFSRVDSEACEAQEWERLHQPGQPCDHPADYREGVNCGLCHDTGIIQEY